jgi:pimeloyl-ACP methyl ester carboxylesterase
MRPCAVRLHIVPQDPNDPNADLLHLPFDEHRFHVRSAGGINVPVYDWGGTGPTLIFCHATGLHGHVWVPLVERLRSSFRCIAIDARGQGDAGLPLDGDLAWPHVTADYVAALDALGLAGRGDVFAVGHSQGGYAAITTALARPGTFAGIYGYEPVIFPLPPGVEPGIRHDNEMAVMVRRRRAEFGSRLEAYENFRSKPPFATADDAIVRAYVQWGFDVRDDGSIALKCSPETESLLFANSPTNAFERLVDVDCHVTLAVAEHTADHFRSCVPQQAERIPSATLVELPGKTHFAPLEDLDATAAALRNAFGV